jgi:chromosome segregation ATPase
MNREYEELARQVEDLESRVQSLVEAVARKETEFRMLLDKIERVKAAQQAPILAEWYGQKGTLGDIGGNISDRSS